MLLDNLKDTIRKGLNVLHLDLTKNLEYDRLTRKIIQEKLQPNSNCIDVGCHKGEILELILKAAPNGKHFAFEPIPAMATDLAQKFSGKVTLFANALAEEKKTAVFNFVKNAPAYSGLLEREYQVKPDIEKIEVQVVTLDETIPKEIPIHFIKIDVEGGEMGVLKGGTQLLGQYKPLLVFEFGKGASEFYGTHPHQLFDFLSNQFNYRINTLRLYLQGFRSLTKEEFTHHYTKGTEYYFVAYL